MLSLQKLELLLGKLYLSRKYLLLASTVNIYSMFIKLGIHLSRFLAVPFYKPTAERPATIFLKLVTLR